VTVRNATAACHPEADVESSGCPATGDPHQEFLKKKRMKLKSNVFPERRTLIDFIIASSPRGKLGEMGPNF